MLYYFNRFCYHVRFLHVFSNKVKVESWNSWHQHWNWIVWQRDIFSAGTVTKGLQPPRMHQNVQFRKWNNIFKHEKLRGKLVPRLVLCVSYIGPQLGVCYWLRRESCTVVDVCFHKRRSTAASITLWFRYNAFALPTRAELLSSIKADSSNDHGSRLKMHSWCGVCHHSAVCLRDTWR